MEHFVRKTDEEISDITAEYEQAEVSRLTNKTHTARWRRRRDDVIRDVSYAHACIYHTCMYMCMYMKYGAISIIMYMY